MPRKAAPIILDPDERDQLASLANSRSLPHGLVRRAKIVLACADGEAGSAVAARMGVNKGTVGKWRRRYLEHGIQGLHDELRPGRPRSHGDERVAEVINTALRSRPEHATHWTARSMAERGGVSKSTVQRWFALFGVQPHRQRTLKLSNDPFFVEKVRDIVGLYLNPPDHAVVLCVDEKTQARTQPVLPLGLGYVEGVTHDYIRHDHAVRGARRGHGQGPSAGAATRSSSASSGTSTAASPRHSTCTSSWTTTRRTPR